jgi:hypothetical protein
MAMELLEWRHLRSPDEHVMCLAVFVDGNVPAAPPCISSTEMPKTWMPCKVGALFLSPYIVCVCVLLLAFLAEVSTSVVCTRRCTAGKGSFSGVLVVAHMHV